MPFNLRNFEEEAKAKMGVVECVSHKLIEPFQVLYEKHSKYFDHSCWHRPSRANSMILSLWVEIVSRHFARTNWKILDVKSFDFWKLSRPILFSWSFRASADVSSNFPTFQNTLSRTYFNTIFLFQMNSLRNSRAHFCCCRMELFYVPASQLILISTKVNIPWQTRSWWSF